jgi:hypothetical protein
MTGTAPTTIAVDHVEYVKELYPRLKPDDAAIERYRDAIDNLPPIVIARGRILVDGFHRWQAHRLEGVDTIPAEDLGDLTDKEILRESYRRNATHGQQLTKADKVRAAEHLYLNLGGDAGERYAEIAAVLSLTPESAEKYCAKARQTEKRIQQDKAWDLWLDCIPQTEIAEQLGVPQPTISRWVSNTEQRSEVNSPPRSRQHFDVWSFDKADDTAGMQSYFGALPPQVVENLLWLYTDPGDVVVDLFAGSGTTIDVAKRMGRRVWASDIRGDHYSPHLPIHKHDATTGWPVEGPSKAKLVVLDPPYWQQAQGRYSDDPRELAELDLDGFYTAWDDVLTGAKDRADRVAYIISPTQLEDGTVVDHATDMLKVAWDLGYTVERRIIVTYQTQQATGQQVEWARENRRLLKLYRDLVVLR